jgi:hypothetical protein
MTAPLVPEVYTPVPQRTQSQVSFDDNADNFLASLPGVATGMNALGVYLDALAVTVDADASNSGISASAATAGALAAQTAAADALGSATSAAGSALTASQQASLATASVASGARPFGTFAAASASLGTLAAGQIIDVVTDETKLNTRSLYQAVGTPVSSLTYLRAVEYYNSPFSYVSSDSINNMITKLLVAVGMVPQSPPALRLNFDDAVYQQN